jgi:tRNA(Ile)-lysidine synthase
MREARHAAYRRFAREWRADAVLLAHQADDRAETLLIRLLAGSGPTGLAAIRPVERVGSLTLARPLLGVRRAELRDYLAARALPWHDDPSNDLADNRRGWIRHVLLPLLAERIGLDPVGRLARAAELLGDEAAAAGEAVGLVLKTLQMPVEPPLVARLDLSHQFWREAGPRLRRQIVREWLWELRRGAYPPGLAAVTEALAFIEQARAGAELRTIERIHIVHAKTSLLAFPTDVGPAARRAAAQAHLPAPPRKKNTKKVL